MTGEGSARGPAGRGRSMAGATCVKMRVKSWVQVLGGDGQERDFRWRIERGLAPRPGSAVGQRGASRACCCRATAGTTTAPCAQTWLCPRGCGEKEGGGTGMCQPGRGESEAMARARHKMQPSAAMQGAPHPSHSPSLARLLADGVLELVGGAAGRKAGQGGGRQAARQTSCTWGTCRGGHGGALRKQRHGRNQEQPVKPREPAALTMAGRAACPPCRHTGPEGMAGPNCVRQEGGRASGSGQVSSQHRWRWAGTSAGTAPCRGPLPHLLAMPGHWLPRLHRAQVAELKVRAKVPGLQGLHDALPAGA